jgi:hypothetical protein
VHGRHETGQLDRHVRRAERRLVGLAGCLERVDRTAEHGRQLGIRALRRDQEPVPVHPGHRQALGAEEVDDLGKRRRVLAEPGSELGRRQEPAVIGTGRVRRGRGIRFHRRHILGCQRQRHGPDLGLRRQTEVDGACIRLDGELDRDGSLCQGSGQDSNGN